MIEIDPSDGFTFLIYLLNKDFCYVYDMEVYWTK